jgi:hypothetical protein
MLAETLLQDPFHGIQTRAAIGPSATTTLAYKFYKSVEVISLRA